MFESILKPLSSSLNLLFQTTEGMILVGSTALLGSVSFLLIKKLARDIEDMNVGYSIINNFFQLQKFSLKLVKVSKKASEVCKSLNALIDDNEERREKIQEVLSELESKVKLLTKIKDTILESAQEIQNDKEERIALRFPKLRALNFFELKINLYEIKTYFKEIKKELPKYEEITVQEDESSSNALGGLKEKAALLFGFGKSSDKKAPSTLPAALHAKHDHRETAKRQRA